MTQVPKATPILPIERGYVHRPPHDPMASPALALPVIGLAHDFLTGTWASVVLDHEGRPVFARGVVEPGSPRNARSGPKNSDPLTRP